MNGREFAEKLNTVRPSLKCLHMSCYTVGVIAHRGFWDEGVNLIQKPFDSDALAAKVREVLDRLEKMAKKILSALLSFTLRIRFSEILFLSESFVYATRPG